MPLGDASKAWREQLQSEVRPGGAVVGFNVEIVRGGTVDGAARKGPQDGPCGLRACDAKKLAPGPRMRRVPGGCELQGGSGGGGGQGPSAAAARRTCLWLRRGRRDTDLI